MHLTSARQQLKWPNRHNGLHSAGFVVLTLHTAEVTWTNVDIKMVLNVSQECFEINM